MKAIRIFVVLSLLTGVIYPLLVTAIAKITMSHQAGGSLFTLNGKVVGSSLIAQKFEEDKYFWPRPSFVNYNPLPSGGSNLGPTSVTLKKLVEERRAHLAKAHQAEEPAVPSELLFASGSGLDPHITPAAAYFQLSRVAKARGLSEKDLKAIVDSHIEGGALLFLGPRYINVLTLNGALDGK